MDVKEFWDKYYDWFLASGIRIILIIFLAFVAMKIAGMVSNRFFKSFKAILSDDEIIKRRSTLGSIIKYVFSATIILVSIVMVLSEFGIEIGAVLAAAGVVGLAIGFGAQHIIKDLISGFFIIMDDELRVGDAVQIAGKTGIVEKLNLRVTVLRDFSGNVHFIPNGTIDVVTNMSKDYSRYIFDIGVAYKENIDEVIKIIKDVDEEFRRDPNYTNEINAPLEVQGLDRFADSAVIIRARYSTRPGRQWVVGREFNRRLKIAFDAKGIEIPFPHMTVYMGEPKQGAAPLMNVRLTKEQ